MKRFYKALIGTMLEIIVLGISIFLFTISENIILKIIGYIQLAVISFIMFKINYEYFESPFYKSLKYPWELKEDKE